MKLDVGQLLCTKDGRKVGNAIITGNFRSYNTKFYRVVTDFGNYCELTKQEIKRLFWLGPVNFDGMKERYKDQLELVSNMWDHVKDWN
jgi:hypothetical protein